jgi:hypothetical protein
MLPLGTRLGTRWRAGVRTRKQELQHARAPSMQSASGKPEETQTLRGR